jgi:hypothetical protein
MNQPEKVTKAQQTRNGVVISEWWSAMLPDGKMFLCAMFPDGVERTEAEAQEIYEKAWKANIQAIQ